MKLKNLLLGTALAVAVPFSASAVTITTDLLASDDVTETYGLGQGVNLVSDSPFDLDIDLVDGDEAGSIEFDFFNDLTRMAVLLGQGTTLSFTGESDSGIMISLGGDVLSYEPGEDAIWNISSMIAVGATEKLTISWGDISCSFTCDEDDENVDVSGQIDVTAVPLPASALLMLGALGGLAAVRRKKA